MRRKFIAGNWKMYNGPSATYNLINKIVENIAGKTKITDALDEKKLEIAIFPPAISIESAIKAKGANPLIVGGQNIHWEREGAFTGEISASMLIEAKCTHVIIGHSERRHIFHETDCDVNRKISSSYQAGLVSVLCVGETLEERESDRTYDVIADQLKGALLGVKPAALADNVIIAYEPVWAIGTGRTASPTDAQNVCEYIRGLINTAYGKDAADKIIVLYGGSAKPENSGEILNQKDIDGLLIGGASLNAESFVKIIESLPNI